MGKKVAIIIATYNQEKLLKECLISLNSKTDYKNYKIFLVDDSGKGKIGKKIIKKFKKIEVINTKGKTGFSGAYNVGIKNSLKWNPDYILLLNDDTEVIEKNWLKEMIKVGESESKIGILGCRILYPNGNLQSLGGHIRGWEITKISNFKEGEILDVDHVMGTFLLIKKEVIGRIGLLDEIYNPYLLEETDYCLRAKKEGFIIKSVSSVKIIHKKSKTIHTDVNNRRMFVRFKNDIIFSMRHLKSWNKFFRIFIFLPIIAIFRKRQDEDDLKIKNFAFRKEAISNIFLLISAYVYSLIKIREILWRKNERVFK